MAMGKDEQKRVSITGLLEEIETEICEDYCKFREMLNEDELEERCAQCPLMKI